MPRSRRGHTKRAARCRQGRVVLAVVGFIGYLVPAVLAAMGMDALIEAAGAEPPRALGLGVMIGVPLLAAWRGATVTAAVGPTDVVVRNRWRRVSVPLGDIEAVEVGTSGPYFLLTFVLSVRDTFASADDQLIGDDDIDLAQMLKIKRRGRRRLAVYGTLGMSGDLDAVRPFLDALAATGHAVDLQQSPAPPTTTP